MIFFHNKVFKGSQTLYIVLWPLMDAITSPKRLKKGSKWGRLHIGVLVRPKIVAWYDFSNTKNLKFSPPP